ncbi:hypothetical protein Q31a_38160 [Aureliella helgolandensis]|uniref:Uncharacterized protein n=1 Tax=Aureliella helgolandensis TaxID=2527968 RepID=A0A518GA91_9BACT|nr:hypothetical protein Q31a_38160 [Aureliella helgolandensis]
MHFVEPIGGNVSFTKLEPPPSLSILGEVCVVRHPLKSVQGGVPPVRPPQYFLTGALASSFPDFLYVIASIYTLSKQWQITGKGYLSPSRFLLRPRLRQGHFKNPVMVAANNIQLLPATDTQ